MRYRLESGVVLEKVAGHDLLITYGEPGRDRMPYVLQVNETGAFFWRLLEKGESPEGMVRLAAAEYDAPEDRIRQSVRQFIEELEGFGYLTAEEEARTET